jgi:hypothetical protein
MQGFSQKLLMRTPKESVNSNHKMRTVILTWYDYWFLLFRMLAKGPCLNPFLDIAECALMFF